MKRSFCLALFLLASSAQATVLRTFVASTGLDTNPCSRVSPCRSFAAALLQTTPTGEIIVLDSAGYGPVTIGQSVSIISPAGVYAGISAPSGEGITISGTSSTDSVVLRGLTINGGGSGSIGIDAGTGGSPIAIAEVHIESCSVTAFGTGISFGPSNASYLFVSDTIVRGNTNFGVRSFSAATSTDRVSIDRLRAERNSYALDLNGNLATATVQNSSFSGNNPAIYAEFLATVDVDHCTITQNSLGIVTPMTSPGTVRVSNSIIVNNGIGLYGANLLTRITGDPVNPVKTNTLTGNTTDGSFTGTFTAQ